MARRSSSQCQHDGTQRSELIIQFSCLGDAAGLECELQTTQSHTKPHSVQVHMILLGSGLTASIISQSQEILAEGRGSVGVSEDGQVDGHLLPASLPDVLGQSGKPGVTQECCFTRPEQRPIHQSESSIIICKPIRSQYHLVKEWTGSGRVGGEVKSGQPSLGNDDIEKQCSSSSSNCSSSCLLALMLCSTVLKKLRLPP